MANQGTPFVLPFQARLTTQRDSLYFYETATTTGEPVYKDAACEGPHRNPLRADAAGVFPAIFLNPDASANYTAQLDNFAGATLFDIDAISRYRENFETGTFEVGYGGFSADPSATTATYYRFGRVVNIELPLGTGTSDSTGFTITGIPAALQPDTTQYCHLPYAEDAGAHVAQGAVAVIATGSGTMQVALASATYGTASWTNSSTKGLLTTASIWYVLADT